MPNHPVEPEPAPAVEQPKPVQPNPTHLPVEPEFGTLAPAHPEDPGAPPPRI